jgi:hypothetical protein
MRQHKQHLRSHATQGADLAHTFYKSEPDNDTGFPVLNILCAAYSTC